MTKNKCRGRKEGGWNRALVAIETHALTQVGLPASGPALLLNGSAAIKKAAETTSYKIIQDV